MSKNVELHSVDLQLPEALYQELLTTANHRRTTLNQVIVDQLAHISTGSGSPTFEEKSILGQVVNGQQIDAATRTVDIKGLFYQFFAADKIDQTKQYEVIDVSGNTVLLHEV